MNDKFYIACDKALKCLCSNQDEILDFRKIVKAIEPYKDIQSVADELINMGFAKNPCQDALQITSKGMENKDYYKDEWRKLERKIFWEKVDRIQNLITTIIAVAGFVISIIALCK